LLAILGGANVWSNFSYGNRINSPNGWLLNAQGSFLILFEKCKKSSRKTFISSFRNLFFGGSKRFIYFPC